MMRQRTMEEWKGRLISFGLETLGGFLVAVALDCFAVNAAFPLTGFSGIALIVNRLWGMPIGATTVLLNIPLAFLCYKLLGRGFFLRSMRCMVISSIFIDYIGPMLPAYDGDRLLAALCYLNVLILIPACCKQRHDAFVKFHLNQGLVVLALATVCACVGFLPHCSELGLTLTLLVDALSLVGLVQTLRGLQTPLPMIWRITKSFHPFT